MWSDFTAWGHFDSFLWCCIELSFYKPINQVCLLGAVLSSSFLLTFLMGLIVELCPSCLSHVSAQVLSSQCWRSCCLSPQSRIIPAGWSSRPHTAAPTKCESWCRSIPTRLVQRFFPLLQSAACNRC